MRFARFLTKKSESLFLKERQERQERKSERAKERRAKERIPNPTAATHFSLWQNDEKDEEADSCDAGIQEKRPLNN